MALTYEAHYRQSLIMTDLLAFCTKQMLTQPQCLLLINIMTAWSCVLATVSATSPALFILIVFVYTTEFKFEYKEVP
jgi:hypothetical protein